MAVLAFPESLGSGAFNPWNNAIAANSKEASSCRTNLQSTEVDAGNMVAFFLRPAIPPPKEYDPVVKDLLSSFSCPLAGGSPGNISSNCKT